MKKKTTKKSAPAKKAVEPKLKVVKQEERNQVKDSIPSAPKPISKAEAKRQLAAAKKQAEEFAKMMEKHQVAAKKKKDEDFNTEFKKAENKLEIYFVADNDGERMDMRVSGFESRLHLAGVLSLMLGKVTQ